MPDPTSPWLGADHDTALCPTCEAPGRLGQPCPERVCSRQASHFIPAEEARTALALSPSQRELLIGQYVGDYLIVGRLGKGGFGKVLLGLQQPLFRLKSAIKLLELHQHDTAIGHRVSQKFENEAAALAVLQHPNIVRCLQYGVFQDQPYLAMELVPGARTLQTEINHAALNHGALEPDVVRHLLSQLLNALEAAHDQDIIHRDIKPENIMLQAVVGDPWHVKVVDFGLAKVVAESRETSVIFGTPVYMAPEQIQGKNLGPWTDLYAVAAVAFELLTGHRAFVHGETDDVIRNKLSSSYDPFARLPRIGLPTLLIDFLRKGLATAPEDRFRSTQAMRAAMNKVFELGTLSGSLTRDLSHLLDSGELSQPTSAPRTAAAVPRSPQTPDVPPTELPDAFAPPTQVAPPALMTGMMGHRRDTPSELGSRQHEDTRAPASSNDPDEAPAPRKRWWWFAIPVVAAPLIAIATSKGDGTTPPQMVTAPPPTAVTATTPTPEPTPTPPTTTASTTPPTPTTPEPAAPPDSAPPDSAPPEPAPRISLHIESTPPGAEVWVDGEARGRTPWALDTVAGARHRLALRLDGHPEALRELEVTPDTPPISVTFAPIDPIKPTPKPTARPSKPTRPKPKITPVFIDD